MVAGVCHVTARYDQPNSQKEEQAQVPVSADLLAAAAEVVEAWAPLAAHPNLGCPRGAFASGELGGGVALFLSHAFWPCALTLEQAHLLPASGPSGARGLLVRCFSSFGRVSTFQGWRAERAHAGAGASAARQRPSGAACADVCLRVARTTLDARKADPPCTLAATPIF